MSHIARSTASARRLEYQAAYAAENYRTLVALARDHAVPLASHDDTTLEHVEQAIKDRVAIAEVSDYCRSRTGVAPARVPILMRAPNVVRGRSHAGNVATVELAGCRAGSVSRRMARMSCSMH
jgi:alpha-D-ribose 1-methylphosphonate 5-triphosphate diphosphatase